MDVLLQFTANWILPVIFFLLVFGFCTMIIVEMLDSMLRWKSRLLARIINRILGNNLGSKFWNHIWANPLGEKNTPAYISPNVFSSIVMHWLIVDFQVPMKKTVDTNEISDALVPLSSESPVLGRLLNSLVEQAGIQNIPSDQYYDYLGKGLENWFMAALDQVSFKYKRLAQKALFSVGIAVAAFSNFDVIEMVSQLWKTSLLKELVDLSEKAGKPVTIDVSLFTTLPLGWDQGDFAIFANPSLVIVKIFGILIGGFLIFISSQYIYDFVKKKTSVGSYAEEKAPPSTA